MSQVDIVSTTWDLGLTRLHELLKVVPIPESIKLEDGSEIGTIGQFLARDENVFTLIAPTNEAISTYEASNPELFDLSKQDSLQHLRDFIYYHMVEGELSHQMILEKENLVSYFNDELIPVAPVKHDLFLAGARVNQVDFPAKNGIIHTVNAVLLPKNG